jgi:predicted RNA methylase
MNDKLLMKIFPKNNCCNIKNLKYDSEGLWSISYPDLANSLTKHIKVFENESFKLDTIIDATAGVGGNVLSFADTFDNVYCIEINDKRFEYLENNIKNYSYNNIKCINGDSINLIKNGLDCIKTNPDVVFFDPPWGGPSYKYIKDIDLKLGDNSFSEIIDLIYLLNKIKLVVLKFPFNYNFLELIAYCNNNKLITQFNIVKENNVVFVFLKMNIN